MKSKNLPPITPTVGMFVTEQLYSDRRVYRVESVSKDSKTAELEMLDAVADPSTTNGEGHQNWILSPTGSTKTVKFYRGKWRFISNEYVFTDEFSKKISSNGFVSGARYLQKTSPELFQKVYNKHIMPSVEVEGITKKVKRYHATKLIFGVSDHYYDWSF